MRILVGATVGFLGATVVAAALVFVGLQDWAAIGGIHIVFWILIAWVAARTRSSPQHELTQAEPPLEPLRGSEDSTTEEQRTYQLTDLEESPDTSNPTEHQHAYGNPKPDETERRHGRGGKTAASRSLLLVIGLSAVSGFLGGLLATSRFSAHVEPTATTTPFAVADVEPSGTSDLSDTELVWCLRDRFTTFAVLRAAAALGFHNFTADLFAFRDGGSGFDVGRDMDLWERKKGEETFDREFAIACRAAFETR